jgi:PKD repeat protein
MFVPSLSVYFSHTAPAAPGQWVQFTAKAAGEGPLGYAWDFGDGLGSAATAAPAYTYTAEGAYTVTLTITDAVGSATYTDTVWIGWAPEAGFESAAVGGATNTVRFTNTTTGTAPLSYLWTFGDGQSSTAASPVHTFVHGGAYTVTLAATNPISGSVASRVVYVPTFREWLPLLAKPE